MNDLAVNQDGPLFNPDLLPLLPKIINELDPRSFVRLARTCREMNQICFHNKDIQISFWQDEIDFGVIQKEEYPTRQYNLWVGEDHRNSDKTAFKLQLETWMALPDGGYRFKMFKGVGRIDSFLKMLSRIPFVFEIRNLEIVKKADEQLLQEIRHYLQAFPRLKICKIYFSHVENWEEVAKFIQEYLPYKAEFKNLAPSSSPASDDILKSIIKTVKVLWYDFHVPDDIISGSSLRNLCLDKATISITTFKELINKFLNGKMEYWNIGRSPPPNEDSDPFIAAVAEVTGTQSLKEIKRSELDSDALYYASTQPNIFYTLNREGKIVRFAIWPHQVQFDCGTTFNY